MLWHLRPHCPQSARLSSFFFTAYWERQKIEKEGTRLVEWVLCIMSSKAVPYISVCVYKYNPILSCCCAASWLDNSRWILISHASVHFSKCFKERLFIFKKNTRRNSTVRDPMHKNPAWIVLFFSVVRAFIFKKIFFYFGVIVMDGVYGLLHMASGLWNIRFV